MRMFLKTNSNSEEVQYMSWLLTCKQHERMIITFILLLTSSFCEGWSGNTLENIFKAI